ncbi:MAG: HD domain-containing protein [Chloroflexi bacterium]|nr:HD domain-containing protein [Chloroflexota bacterium]
MDLSEILQIAIESAADLLRLGTGAIYTLEEKTLILGATTPPLPPQFPDELRVASLDDHPHIKQAILTMTPVTIFDVHEETITQAERVVIEARHLISILYFPLLLKGEALGVFIVGDTEFPRRFTPTEIDLCYMLSFQASLAIANSRLYQKAQQAITDISQAYDATLAGWSRVLDMRDHVTDEHTHRVADLAVALARNMGIPEADIGHVRRGALMHDIGKMALPDSILQKKESLTEDEWKVMRTHPEKAYDLLSHIEYLAPALDIPYCHHERWDGTGYPRGLKGEEIPLVARLFAVVDTYDAITSNRPYRKGWDGETAIQYIREQAGRQFCPTAVKAFCEMMGK